MVEAETEEVEVSEEMDVTSLPGVGPATKTKLNDAGIFTILDLATAGPADIADATDVDITKAVDLNNKARKKLVEIGRLEPDFISASELLTKRKNISRLSTGSANLDELLAGGIETWAMTEFYGEFGSGKCVTGDTKVIYTNDAAVHLENIADAYGKYEKLNGEKPFEEGFVVPVPSVKVFGYDSQPTQATYLYKERVPYVVDLRTERGRRLSITPTHKLLTITEVGLRWISAQSLRKGDAVATPKSIGANTRSVLDADDAYFLGLFVAEGSSNPLSIVNADKRLIGWTVQFLERKFGFTPTIAPDLRRPHVKTILLREPVKALLGKLIGTNSYTKFVPEEVLSADDDVVRAFLAGYIDGDGHVADEGVEVSSNSKRLIEEVSYLFSRLGVSSTFSQKKVKGGATHYRLLISGFDRAIATRLPYRAKAGRTPRMRNSRFGTPLGVYLRRVFREAVSSTRWHFRRVGSFDKNATLYEIFTRSAYERKGIADPQLRRIGESFRAVKAVLEQKLAELESVSLEDRDEFRKFAHSLPFDFNIVSRRMGITKSGAANYYNRGVPRTRVEEVRTILRDEAESRVKLLNEALSTIHESMKFNWDRIVDSKVRRFDDYVYDFVVPDGHAFVGGNLPTVLHNTQICHTLCAMVQLPTDQGGLDGGAVYIDTEGTFRPERLAQIAEARGMDPEAVLSKVMVARAYNSAHQELIAKDLGRIIEKNTIKLVIVDSAVAHYRAEFLGRGTLAERQQRLNRFLHQLLRTAEIYNIAIILTNQVQSAPDSFFGDPTRATGGHVVAHTSTYRIYLRKAGKNRIARMVDSPYHPERDAVFMLDEKGVDDPPEESSGSKRR
ncbi:MAG TPA: DNA repair and recombination protein RadA [Nitrososphaerales archaeon]|nr:DNA repair and recombination protein RadA [Nitrososphaerales archaeon]